MFGQRVLGQNLKGPLANPIRFRIPQEIPRHGGDAGGIIVGAVLVNQVAQAQQDFGLPQNPRGIRLMQAPQAG